MHSVYQWWNTTNASMNITIKGWNKHVMPNDLNATYWNPNISCNSWLTISLYRKTWAQSCGFDAAGEALNHLLGGDLKNRS